MSGFFYAMTAPRETAPMNGRRLLLGVTGGIAAYKSAELIRLFKKAGADVQVLMTEDAVRFITPLTLGTLSEREVLLDLFPQNGDGSWTKHVSLGNWADLLVIAPATAQTLAKLANGFCDNMLTATALAARCPILVCPAMDHDMFVHPATQRNIEVLKSFGYEVIPPAYGELASGMVGEGRLPEPIQIFEHVAQRLTAIGDSNTTHPSTRSDLLPGRRVLVTAGPTREHIDPVRFISNPSSGKMGYALAEAAARRGANVTLVSGPTQIEAPGGVKCVDVTSAAEMYDAVMEEKDADLVIMAAAVADYVPAESSVHKTKKADSDAELRLRRTRDILADLGSRKKNGQVLVGFAMETQNGLVNARAKLESKNLDWIVLNMLTDEGSGFGADTNQVILLHRDGGQEALPLMSKRNLADELLDRVAESLPRT